MVNLLFVGVGGFLGACARYGISNVLSVWLPHFPLGTLLSNIIAGFLVGFLIGLERQSVTMTEHTKLFLTTGMFGGLSTFSTFSLETVTMFERGNYVHGGLNIFLNITLCLIFVLLGITFAKSIQKV